MFPQSKSVRRAITFEEDLYDYIDEIATLRNEPFARVCGSMLREIMRDEKLSNRATH